MSDYQQGPGWWLASDLKWYPPAPPRLPPPPPSKAGWFASFPAWERAAYIIGVLILLVAAIVTLAIITKSHKVAISDSCGTAMASDAVVGKDPSSTDKAIRQADDATLTACATSAEWREAADTYSVPIGNTSAADVLAAYCHDATPPADQSGPCR